MAIAWYYDESKHPGGGASIPGVPLADLTDEQFAEQPPHAQRAIEKSDMYRKTKPVSSTKPAPAKKKTAKEKPSTKPAPAAPADEPIVPEPSADDAPAPEQEG